MKLNKEILDFLYSKKHEYLNEMNDLKEIKVFDSNSNYQYEHPILEKSASEKFLLIGEITYLYIDRSQE